MIPPLLSEKLLPSHIIGALSLVLLAIACIALYVMKLAGAWRWIYVLTALVALYLNVFVLVIQSFLKMPALTRWRRACRRPDRRSRSPGHRAGVLRDRDHRRLAALPPDVKLRLSIPSFRGAQARTRNDCVTA